MSDGKLQYEIEIAGTDQAAAGLGDVEAGLDRIASSEKRLSDNSTSFSRDIDSATTNMSKGAYAAESSFGRFASYLGGPWGFAILAGLNVAVGFWSKIKSEAEESERKIKEVSAAIREMVGEWNTWLSRQQKKMGVDPASRANSTIDALTKEEARAQVPLMEAEYSRYMKIAERNSSINQANYKKFIEGGGNKNEWQDDPRVQKAKDRVEYYGDVINALKNRIDRVDVAPASVHGGTNSPSAVTGTRPARPEDWNGLLERQIELQNSEFLLTVKDDLERLKLERSRLVSERDAVDGIGFSSQEKRLEYSEKILQVENQIRAMQDAKSKNEEVARANLEARKEEYELSKKSTAEQLKAVEAKMAALRKGPKNVETEGQMLDLKIRRDALSERLASEAQNRDPGADPDTDDDDPGRRVVDGADYSMKEFNPRRRRFRSLGRQGFMGKGQGRSSAWFASQTAGRFAAAGHVGVTTEMGQPPLDVKGIDQINRQLAEIKERL